MTLQLRQLCRMEQLKRFQTLKIIWEVFFFHPLGFMFISPVKIITHYQRLIHNSHIMIGDNCNFKNYLKLCYKQFQNKKETIK